MTMVNPFPGPGLVPIFQSKIVRFKKTITGGPHLMRIYGRNSMKKTVILFDLDSTEVCL